MFGRFPTQYKGGSGESFDSVDESALGVWQECSDLTGIRLIQGADLARIALHLLALFGENVAHFGGLVLDLTFAGKAEPLLCAAVCLHFWHVASPLPGHYFLGARIRNICRPSIRGRASMTEKSSQASAIRMHCCSPISR